jgi:uncharacterized membrane protein
MMKNNKEWLDNQINDWVSNGWISKDAQQQIRNACGMQEDSRLRSAASLYSILIIIGLSVLGMGIIWGSAQVWYHVPMAARIGIAAGILIISQIGIGAVMLQERQGTILAEGIGVVHCLAVFVAVAMAEQTFYIGWDLPSYAAACAILCLPAMYLLRAVGCTIVYGLAVLYWAALGGPLNAMGGAGFMWVMVVLAIPFYRVLARHNEEIRLAVFSWVMTITVFAAFGLAALTADYIPFLMLATLAVAIMLTGYSIDIRKAWGVPFRWFGRFAAAGSLLISCMPASWHGIAEIQGFHWTTMAVTVILFMAIVILLAKGVKKRLWGPVVYVCIPVILAGETMLVRSGLYSSVPLIISSVYMLFLGFYETAQGLQPGHFGHAKFGVVILASLVLSFIFGTSFSPLVPVIAIVILGLAIFQIRRVRNDKKAAAQRSDRRLHLKHRSATIRSDRDTRRSRIEKKEIVPPAYAIDKRNPQEDAETVAEWMKGVHMPPMRKPVGPQGRTENDGTIIHKSPDASAFVAPVFRDPDVTVLPHAAERSKPQQQERIASSPWQSMKPAAKREKQPSRSPWAQEGESKK